MAGQGFGSEMRGGGGWGGDVWTWMGIGGRGMGAGLAGEGWRGIRNRRIFILKISC